MSANGEAILESYGKLDDGIDGHRGAIFKYALEFLQAAAYAGLQTPINGLVQIIDRYAPFNILPHIQIIQAPEQARFGSVDWLLRLPQFPHLTSR